LTIGSAAPVADAFITARVLEGRGLAAEIRAGVRRQVSTFRRRYGYSPTLAAVMVGRELGAGFVTAYCGDMLMPGLPSNPSGEDVDINADGETVGLF